MQSRLLLDVIIGQGPSVLQLFSNEYEPLLVRLTLFLVMYLSHALSIVSELPPNLKGDGLASTALHKYLHAAPEGQNQMQNGLFLDVIICQRLPSSSFFPTK